MNIRFDLEIATYPRRIPCLVPPNAMHCLCHLKLKICLLAFNTFQIQIFNGWFQEIYKNLSVFPLVPCKIWHHQQSLTITGSFVAFHSLCADKVVVRSSVSVSTETQDWRLVVHFHFFHLSIKHYLCSLKNVVVDVLIGWSLVSY